MNLKDRYGSTALQLSSRNGHVEIAKTLISAGAGINIPDTKLQTPFLGKCKVYGHHKDSIENLGPKYRDLLDLWALEAFHVCLLSTGTHAD